MPEEEFEMDPLDQDDVPEVVENVEPDEKFYPVEYSISSYGADYPVDGLVKRIDAGSIYIPKFQRGYVWNIYRDSSSRFYWDYPFPPFFSHASKNLTKCLLSMANSGFALFSSSTMGCSIRLSANSSLKTLMRDSLMQHTTHCTKMIGLDLMTRYCMQSSSSKKSRNLVRKLHQAAFITFLNG